MPTEWYQVDHVGFNRAFVVGVSADRQEIEQELTPEQLRMYSAFLDVQAEARSEFVKGLIL